MSDKLRDKSVEHTDPITGEIVTHDPGVRPRIRDVFIDDIGRELPDPRPVQPPVGYKKQPSMFELIREATAREVALYAANREPETFEEADDFDVDDDIDPHSPWENEFDPPWSEVRRPIEEKRREEAETKARKASESPPEPKTTVPKTGGNTPPEGIA